MFIFNGKFNWFLCASNETITFVFPAGFSLNDPIVQKKASTTNSGIVNSITTTADGYSRIRISFGYDTFDASVSANYKTLSVTMRNPCCTSSGPFDLSAMHIDTASICSALVYTCRLEWSSYAKDKMMTLVVPYGVAEGAFFGLYHQWAVDSKNVEKVNRRVNGVFQDVQYSADGRVTAVYKGEYYSYNFMFSGKEGSFVLSNPQGNKSQDNKFTLTYIL